MGPQRSCEMRAGAWRATSLETGGQYGKIDGLAWKEIHRTLQRLAPQNKSEKPSFLDSFP